MTIEVIVTIFRIICNAMEIDMKKALAIAAVLALGAAGAATAAELPSYEKEGFPITLHRLPPISRPSWTWPRGSPGP